MKELKECGFNTSNKTYIIAEIGLNHQGSLDVAKDLIRSASKTGVDAVKFQTYITEKRVAKDSPIFDILKDCELPFDDFVELSKLSEDLGVEFFSTPFDKESADFLDEIGTEIFKIASLDVTNNDFIQHLSSLSKNIILSVGMANREEIENAYNILTSQNSRVSILHCISSYPTLEEDANLSVIKNLINLFPDAVVGQSDHTNDIKVPLYAICCGAQIIEKHFKIDDQMECVDAPVSITEMQMKKLVEEARIIEKIMGCPDIEPKDCEEGSLIFRRN